MQEGKRAPTRQWRTENRIVLVLGPWLLGASGVEAVGTQLFQILEPVFCPGKETGLTWVFQAFAGGVGVGKASLSTPPPPPLPLWLHL